MCVLRILQRKKFIGKSRYDAEIGDDQPVVFSAHVKSTNGSEYYCDGLHKSLNPDYATTPCLQHGVVAVDGKLIPFAYPTNPKQAMLWHGQAPLPHSSTTMTTTENGTIRLNTNPMTRLDNEANGDAQENFYHTLTPFSTHSQYGEQEPHTCTLNQPGMFVWLQGALNSRLQRVLFDVSALFAYPTDGSTMSSCPVHHRMMNYPSDTFPLKGTLNSKEKSGGKKSHGIILSSQNPGIPFSHLHHHHHHATCQRYQKSKRMITPIINECMLPSRFPIDLSTTNALLF